MTTPLTTDAFKTTYKDDFADSSGFHRILFNAGKALQAREVTQLQTILQNQILMVWIFYLVHLRWLLMMD